MTKRDKIFQKFNGLCAYTGKPLGEDWQIDHAYPKRMGHMYSGNINDDRNLYPCLKIVNHYKRGYGISGFRSLLSDLHVRIGKLPKNPRCDRRKKYKDYMLKVASAFDVDKDKPFNGLFYFEKINGQAYKDENILW
jgi:hypothetical protein